MVYLVIVFSIYQPLVAIAGFMYFGIKSFLSLAALTNYFKEQIYARCKLLDMTLSRARHASSFAFFLLSLKFYIMNSLFYFGLNFIFFITSVGICVWFPVKSFDIHHLFNTTNFLKFGMEVN